MVPLDPAFDRVVPNLADAAEKQEKADRLLRSLGRGVATRRPSRNTPLTPCVYAILHRTAARRMRDYVP